MQPITLNGSAVIKGRQLLSSALDKLERIRVSWLVLSAVLITFWSILPIIVSQVRAWNSNALPSWTASPQMVQEHASGLPFDLDTKLIHDGLIATPRFQDTFRWWTGRWVGQVPFYRPITSLLFWMEWKAWGDHEARYNLIAGLIHLGAVSAFVWLAWRLFTHFKLSRPNLGAILSALMITTGLALISGQPEINADVCSKWKNQPDALCLLFFCLSLAFYLRHMDHDAGHIEGERPARTLLDIRAGATAWRQRDLSLALLFYLACCGTKEAGVFLPLLLPILEIKLLWAGGEKRRAALRRMLPLLISLPIFLIYRAWCLNTFIGYQYGSGSSWRYEFSLNALGPASEAMVQRDWPAVGLTTCLLAEYGYLAYVRLLAAAGRRSLLRSTLMMLGFPVLILLATSELFVLAEKEDYPNVAVALMVLFLYYNLLRSLRITVFLILIIQIFVKRTQMAFTLYSWNLFALALIVFSPAVIHRFYLGDAGLSLLLCGGFVEWLQSTVELPHRCAQTYVE